jgi:drug/metabolite transporter (DMT)-like permease
MTDRASKQSENLIGISLMTAGMASGAGADAMIKVMSNLADTRLIAAVVGFGMASMFAFAAGRSGQKVSVQDLVHRTVLLRTACEVVGVFGLVFSLSLVSLTTVTALTQTVPLLVTLGAVLFFGERATLHEWMALLAGLMGMLLIVKPASNDFQPNVLVAVAAVIVLATRDLASRAVPPAISTVQLGFWGGLALGTGSLVLVILSDISWPPMSLSTVLGFALIVLLACATFYCITAAMRVGTVAVISPFRYTRLVFGVLLGIILFGETLDIATTIGAMIVVAAGLHVWWKQIRNRR